MFLRLTDNQDGTGLTATVGESGGTAVSVFWRPYPESWLDQTSWAGPVTRTGDGDVTLPVHEGIWWAFAAEGAAVTGPVSGYATDAPTPLRTRVRKAVVEAIKALPFPAVRSVTLGGRVVEQAEIDPTFADLPAVMVSNADEVSEVVEPDMNATRLVGLPHVVAFLMSNRGPEVMDVLDAWRPLVIDRFNGPRPPGIPEAVRSQVEPAVVARPEDGRQFNVRSAVVVRVFCRVYQPQGV